MVVFHMCPIFSFLHSHPLLKLPSQLHFGVHPGKQWCDGQILYGCCLLRALSSWKSLLRVISGPKLCVQMGCSFGFAACGLDHLFGKKFSTFVQSHPIYDGFAGTSFNQKVIPHLFALHFVNIQRSMRTTISLSTSFVGYELALILDVFFTPHSHVHPIFSIYFILFLPILSSPQGQRT